jgi:hypothetical protein
MEEYISGFCILRFTKPKFVAMLIQKGGQTNTSKYIILKQYFTKPSVQTPRTESEK